MLRSGQLYKVIFNETNFERKYIIFSPLKDISVLKLASKDFVDSIQSLFHINLVGDVNVYGHMGFHYFKKVEKPSKDDILEVKEKIKEYNKRGKAKIIYNEKTNSIKLCDY